MRTIDLNNDLEVLFGTIDGEAENQPVIGQIGVGCSIATRAKMAAQHSHFGDGTIKGACLAHDQYSCWLPGPDHDRIMAIDLDNLSPIQIQIMGLAQQIIAGTIDDPTNSATHYYAKSIPGPAWLVGARFHALLGDQLFWGGVK